MLFSVVGRALDDVDLPSYKELSVASKTLDVSSEFTHGFGVNLSVR